EPLRELQRARGDEARLLEGATKPRERSELARDLGKKYRVLLAQMDAGGIGLNFTGAESVVFVHLAWTAAAHRQAMDRVHRIGQDKPVLVEFYASPGTIDEKIAGIVLRKEADSNLVLAEDADTVARAELLRSLVEEYIKA
ncbi:MAG: C-terminal helicase domain-containing protein, partial [Methanobacteriota archaeon]